MAKSKTPNERIKRAYIDFLRQAMGRSEASLEAVAAAFCARSWMRGANSRRARPHTRSSLAGARATNRCIPWSATTRYPSQRPLRAFR
ncbi:MAG: hypothetical protein CR217_17465 [Beijerinckiaceae bacterium]|nr:MAG: hypothetical protein CR217_17465 [Beijerinckiaceae bacterium]